MSKRFTLISKIVLAVLFIFLSVALLGLGVWGDMHGYPSQGSYRFAFAVASALIQIVFLFIPRRIGLQILTGVLGLTLMGTVPGRLAEYRYNQLEAFRINNTVISEITDEPLYTDKGTAIGVIIKFKAKLPVKEYAYIYPWLVSSKTSAFYATPNDMLVADVMDGTTPFRLVKRTVEPKTTNYQELDEHIGLPVPDLIPDSGLFMDKDIEYKFEFELVPSALKRIIVKSNDIPHQVENTADFLTTHNPKWTFCWVPLSENAPTIGANYLKLDELSKAKYYRLSEPDKKVPSNSQLEISIHDTTIGQDRQNYILTKNYYDIVQLYENAQKMNYPVCSKEQVWSIY